MYKVRIYKKSRSSVYDNCTKNKALMIVKNAITNNAEEILVLRKKATLSKQTAKKTKKKLSNPFGNLFNV